jgi:hypothetical protein
VLHEVHHIFGINSVVYEYFYDRSTDSYRDINDILITGESGKFPDRVKSPKVLEWTKSHYNCPSATGLPIENSGGEGSKGAHWEKFLVGNEMMNPTDYFNVVNSALNFAFVEDMGYYVPDYGMEEYLVWGKNAGCSIFTGDCSSNPVTCVEDEYHCSPAHYSIGQCTKDPFSEDCPMFHEIPYGDCRLGSNEDDFDHDTVVGLQAMYFGNGGRCVEGKIHADQTVQQGNCLKMTCNSLTSLTVNVLDNDHECTDQNVGQQIDLGNNLYIVCPDPAVVCLSELNCPNDCNHNGRCLSNGNCWCYNGFTGSDCSEVDENPFELIIAGSKGYLMLFTGLLLLHLN